MGNSRAKAENFGDAERHITIRVMGEALAESVSLRTYINAVVINRKGE